MQMYKCAKLCKTKQDSMKVPNQSLGPCPYPQPISRFYSRDPSSFSHWVQSMCNLVTSICKSGRSHQRLALHNLAFGGICQGHSTCLCMCHYLCCFTETQHIISGLNRSTDMGHFNITVCWAVQSRGHLMRLPAIQSSLLVFLMGQQLKLNLKSS